MDDMEKMFEMATRSKMRFTFKGMLSVEDLWDLSVRELDTIYKGLNSQLKQVKEESLLDTKTAADKELEAKIEIIKYIVKTKQDELNDKLQAKAKRERNDKIKEILAKKQDESLENMSEEDLKKLLEEN
jgi:hypothetical protein